METTERLRGNENSGAVNESRFFHIEILPKQIYKRFRRRDVDEKVGIASVDGQLSSGEWETVKWIVSSEIAHVENGELVADNNDAQELLDKIGFVPQHIEGNRYGAKARLQKNSADQ